MNKGKAVGIAGALTVVAGALWAGWYFLIKAKADDLSDARAEVMRWEERVTSFRACMFGAKPLSDDSAEALALRAMLPVTGEQTSCTEYAKKLNRGVANDTGNLTIEQAWMSVDRAASKVATAYVVYKSDYGITEADRRRGVSDLPTALEELDTARKDLRIAARMPSTETVTTVLPKPEIIPVRGSAGLLRTFEDKADTDIFEGTKRALPSRGSVIAFAKGGDSKVWRILHAAGATPVVVESVRTATRSPPSYPAGDWFVNVTETGTEPGPLPAGSRSPATITTSATAPVEIANTESVISEVLALGTPANGVIVYSAHRDKTREEAMQEAEVSHSNAGPGRKLVFASATNAFPAQSFPLQEGAHVIDAQGNAVVAWTEPVTTTMRAAFITPGKPPAIVELGTDVAQRMCMTTGYAWVTLFNGQVVRVSPQGMDPIDVRHRLLGCGDRAAVFHDIRDEFEVCAKDCRRVSLIGSGDTQHVAVSDENVVAIRMRDKVLGVWTEGKPPAFYGLPDVLEARAVVANGKVVDVLAMVNTTRPQDQQVMVVRVPMP